jgi:hypothetical protein
VIEKTSVSDYSILPLIVFMLLFILLIYANVYFINLVIVYIYRFLTPFLVSLIIMINDFA